MTSTSSCPECGASLQAARQATAEERAAVARSADHAPLPPSWDTAAPDQIDEHGPLYRCTRCAFSARIKP